MVVKIFNVEHKIPRYLLIYYKISFVGSIRSRGVPTFLNIFSLTPFICFSILLSSPLSVFLSRFLYPSLFHSLFLSHSLFISLSFSLYFSPSLSSSLNFFHSFLSLKLWYKKLFICPPFYLRLSFTFFDSFFHDFSLFLSNFPVSVYLLSIYHIFYSLVF